MRINSWILTGVACLVLLMAVALFFIAFGADKKSNRYLDIGTEETGVIKIADSTFKEMINKNAKAVAGVIGSKSAIKCEDKNVSVIIKAELEEDVVIPQVVHGNTKPGKDQHRGHERHNADPYNVLVENKHKE